jgi:hypothetical protein
MSALGIDSGRMTGSERMLSGCFAVLGMKTSFLAGIQPAGAVGQWTGRRLFGPNPFSVKYSSEISSRNCSKVLAGVSALPCLFLQSR